ncbi:MAG: epoxyqueuosine reductase QueH [Bacillota bacterium]
MKPNRQTQTDAVLEALGNGRKSLLLQCCCGPCSSYVLEYLSRYFDLTLLFYNPNIQPQAEYDRRLETLRQLMARDSAGVRLLDCDYDGAAFTAAARGLEAEPEGGARCTACFALRLRETAKRAREEQFDYFCTTLSVSPHKDAERINLLGEALEAEYGVKWLPSDFKKRGGYARSVALAKDYGLYRQAYCGCLFSRTEAEKTMAGRDGSGENRTITEGRIKK